MSLLRRMLGALTLSALFFGACLGRARREDCACGPGRGSIPAADPSEEPAAAPEVPAPAASASSALPDFSDPTWTRTPSRGGKYLVCWRSLTGTLPRNQDFDLEVWLLRDGAPASEAFLSVNAWMPDHGHGMLRRPRPEARGDGSFLVEGMLLHMRGHWQLTFDVLEGTLAETAECALEL